MARTCLFCGETLTASNRAEEHILPKWMWPYVGLSSKSKFMRNRVKQTPLSRFQVAQHTKNERTHTINGFVEGRVCDGCNGGWMNDLENEARPVLVAGMRGALKLERMDDDQKDVLSRWALKTALTLAFGSDVGPRIPKQHYESALTQTIPARVVILGRMEKSNKGFHWNVGHNWLYTIPKELEGTAEIEYEYTLSGYKVCLLLNALCLIVAFPPSEQWIVTFPAKEFTVMSPALAMRDDINGRVQPRLSGVLLGRVLLQSLSLYHANMPATLPPGARIVFRGYLGVKDNPERVPPSTTAD